MVKDVNHVWIYTNVDNQYSAHKFTDAYTVYWIQLPVEADNSCHWDNINADFQVQNIVPAILWFCHWDSLYQWSIMIR